MNLTKQAIRCAIAGEPFSKEATFGDAINAAAELHERGILDDLRQQAAKLKREAILLVEAKPQFADKLKSAYEAELDKLVEMAARGQA